MDEAEKQQAQEQAAVREQRDAEGGDVTMAEEQPEAPAEVFSVDGSGQLQRENEAETEAQRDAEEADETMEEPRVVGTILPLEVFDDEPGDFPEQKIISQPGPGIKGEQRMDDSSEEEKEPEPPPKKQAIDPRINESTEDFSQPGIRLSYKDHPYTEKQAAEILEGEGGADVVFDEI